MLKLKTMLKNLLITDDSAIIEESKYKLLFILLACIVLIAMGFPQLHLGYIRAGKLTLTLMHIPVLCAVVFAGFSGAVVSSLVFGIISLVNALAVSGGAMSEFLKNPLCSVFPRLLFGLIAWWIFSVISKRISVAFGAGISAFAASFLHSFLVMGAVYLFFNRRALVVFNKTGYFELMQKLLPGVLLEAVMAAIVLFVLSLVAEKLKPCKGGN